MSGRLTLSNLRGVHPNVALSNEERQELPGLLLEIADYRRPRTRGECGTERPCPWVSCRHHLYLEVTKTGSIRLNTEQEAWEMAQSCALDIVDAPRPRLLRTYEGELHLTLDEIAAQLHLTRERVRQIEEDALAKLKTQLATRREEVTP